MSAISEYKCANKKRSKRKVKKKYMGGCQMPRRHPSLLEIGSIAVPRNLSLRPSSGPWQWPLKCTFISPTVGRRWLRRCNGSGRNGVASVYIKGQLQIDQLPRGADGGCSLWKRDRLLLELICDYCGKVITRTRVHLYLGRSQLFKAIKVPGQTARIHLKYSKRRLGECASY